MIAAVESYLRGIFRRLIALDPICQDGVHRREVSYGAAVHLSKAMLPEAILEKISFISKASIVDSIKDLLGVKGNIPPDVISAVDDYVRVCQLRHCAVHRFGKLGVSNAISLGLDSHKELLEKPLLLNYAALQASISISTGLVKVINNFLFNEVISRIPSGQWTGVFKNDKKLFKSYYLMFADTVSSTRAADLRTTYNLLLAQRTQHASGQPF
ncbi:hypothetical protein CJO86_13905 [Ralstonia solanacearum]|nr:hypothetical protein CJO86_13905 [Ralstonia solanacearum]